MNRSSWMKVFVILLLAAALTGVSVAAAQGEEPAPAKEMPAVIEKGESASPAANLTESEPNNGFGTADTMTVGDVMSGKIGTAGDVDFYTFTVGARGNLLFDIDAASQGSPLDAYICLYNSDLSELECNDDSDGLDPLLFRGLYSGHQYFLRVSSQSGNVGGATHTYKLAVYAPLFVSAPVSGKVAGIAFRPEDILAHYDFANGTEKWLVFFDGSDVGISRNITGFAAYGYEGETILSFSFQQNQYIDPSVGTATPNDVVWCMPANLGPNTTCDGWRNIGMMLEAASEKVDAIGVSTDLFVGVSTVGTLTETDNNFQTLKAQDEDLACGGVSLSWFDGFDGLCFDGSDIRGLAAEDVFAADRQGSVWYLTILGSGVIDGLPLNQKDIFMVRDGVLLGRYWNGPAHHFNYNIDAIDVND